jgi:hypothetical protein
LRKYFNELEIGTALDISILRGIRDVKQYHHESTHVYRPTPRGIVFRVKEDMSDSGRLVGILALNGSATVFASSRSSALTRHRGNVDDFYKENRPLCGLSLGTLSIVRG